MAKSIAKAFTENKTDELYTPRILAEAILPELEKLVSRFLDRGIHPIVWLPFDKEESEFAYICKELNLKYIATHIDDGKDFFSYEPPEYDIILSNPPFSRKLDVMLRCVELGKPWALVHNIMMWNYHEIGDFGFWIQKLYKDKPLQVLFTNKRVSYDGNPSSFGSGYVCQDFLEKDFMFAELPHNNTNKYFIPSRMYTFDQLVNNWKPVD